MCLQLNTALQGNSVNCRVNDFRWDAPALGKNLRNKQNLEEWGHTLPGRRGGHSSYERVEETGSLGCLGSTPQEIVWGVHMGVKGSELPVSHRIVTWSSPASFIAYTLNLKKYGCKGYIERSVTAFVWSTTCLYKLSFKTTIQIGSFSPFAAKAASLWSSPQPCTRTYQKLTSSQL